MLLSSLLVGDPRARRWLRLLGFLAVAALAYAVWRPGGGNERAVARTLEAIAESVAVRQGEFPGERDRRLQAALEKYFTDPVSVRHRDLPATGSGRRALLLWGRLLGRYKLAELALEHPTISVGNNGRAVVKLDAVLNAQEGTERYVDQRSVQLDLIDNDGQWQVEGIEVAPRAQQQPEARP